MTDRAAAHADGSGGFSTLEFLVAFVILSISLGIAVQGISQAVSNLKRARQDEQASAMLQRVLAEDLPIALAQNASSGGIREGTGWRLELQPAGEAEGSRVVRAVITLTPAPDGRAYRYVTLHTQQQ